jgi:uncharacterized membrane protein
MWFIEIALIIAFFTVGIWMPTDLPDAYAIRRGVQVENKKKRETIHRAGDDYNKRYPWSRPLYTRSIVAFAVGFIVVMFITIRGQGEALEPWQNVGAAIGYAVQVVSFLIFAICSLTKRHALVKALHQKKDLRRSD